MALGGGIFLTQNKILPGVYINFVSAARATANLSDRGIATIPLILDWGVQNEVKPVTTGDFQKDSLKLFGYDYAAPELKGLRDLFKNINIAYLYRLGKGGKKASNKFATAIYTGTIGNKLTVGITKNVDKEENFDVSLFFDGNPVETQIVSSSKDLKDNDFVIWDKTVTLDSEALTSGMPLKGGASPEIQNDDYQAYLDLIEGYSFNAIGCPSDDDNIKGLFTAFTKRLRDEQGVKFQCVVYDKAADYEGVVNVKNETLDSKDKWSAVYWVTGVVAGTAVNKSALNKVYDGEYTLDVNFKQSELENAIKTGKFAFHRVGSDIRVLADINSLVSLEKGEDFKQNQTIRVIDQIANDIAVLFNTKYLGIVPNDASGRISLWADIVLHHEQLQKIRAIENFSDKNIIVEQGISKRSVVVYDRITVVNAMAQLYMTVTVA